MGSLSNLYISQSYQSLIHLGTNTSASATQVELEDGIGQGLGIFVNTNGDVSIDGSLIVSGTFDIEGKITVNDSVRVNGNLEVSGATSLTGSLDVSQNITASNVLVENNLIVSGTFDIEGRLVVNDNVRINGDLEVSGSQRNTGSLFVSNAISSSTITGIGNVTAFSQSLYAEFTNIENYTSSLRAAFTASGIDTIFTNDITASNIEVRNNINVVGTITANKIVTLIESSSIIYSSGSNILGDEVADTQTLIGSVIMSGSASLTGSMGITNDLNVIGNISSSTISGIGNVTTFSQSVDSRLDDIEVDYATTGSNSFNGNQTITGSLTISSSAEIDLNVIGNSTFSGSVRGNVIPITITSQTASMDCSLGNFFTLQLAGVTTRLVPTNILPGETISLRITQGSSPATLIYGNEIGNASGSYYAPTFESGAIDILTFISFDNVKLNAVGVKNIQYF